MSKIQIGRAYHKPTPAPSVKREPQPDVKIPKGATDHLLVPVKR